MNMKHNTFKAALFDLDGTLLDTLEDIADSMNNVLKQHGFPEHPIASYKITVGLGVRNLVTQCLPEEARIDHTIQACFDAFMREYGDNPVKKTKPYPGVLEMLSALTAKSIPFAILSNKNDPLTQKIVPLALPGIRFGVVQGSRPDVPKKPDPYSALAIAKRLGVEPSQMLYAGDSGIDMETANRAGMFALGVLWGFRDKDELVSNGSHALVSTPEEILQFLI